MTKAEEFETLAADTDSQVEWLALLVWCKGNRALIARALKTQEMLDNTPESLLHDIGLVALAMTIHRGPPNAWTAEEIGRGCIAALREAVK